MRKDQTPSILVSLSVHLLILLLLALSGIPQRFGFFGNSSGEPSLVIGLEQSSDSTQAEVEVQLSGEPDSVQNPTELSALSELTTRSEIQPTTTSIEPLIQLNPSSLVARGETFSSSDLSNPSDEKLKALSGLRNSAQFSHSGVEGRQSGNRSKLAIERGGSLESERAVEAALEWLAAHQRPSGGWSVWHHEGACNGRCRDPGIPVLPGIKPEAVDKHQYAPAATGLALLAFLGAGYTHLDGKYQQNVRRGLYFLREIFNADNDPQGGSFMNVSEQGMYNQGIATFALCEAYQLTNDPDLKNVCQKAIDFIVNSQNYQGGWGYFPRTPGDLTITGWQMMALKSASAAKLDVPFETLWKLDQFRKTQLGADQVHYFYRSPLNQSINCTAIALLMRMFLGHTWTSPDFIAGLDSITNHTDYGKDIYYRYYTTLTLFHVGGPRWEAWNQLCRDQLIATQATEGHEAGSWHFDNHFGNIGGRLYTTAMATMTLEVYYRFSPLYQQADRPFEL